VKCLGDDCVDDARTCRDYMYHDKYSWKIGMVLGRAGMHLGMGSDWLKGHAVGGHVVGGVGGVVVVWGVRYRGWDCGCCCWLMGVAGSNRD
jgi:hypothetical protein